MYGVIQNELPLLLRVKIIQGWAAEALTVSCDGDNLEFGEDNRKRPTLVTRRVHSGLSLWWSGVSGGCRLF